MSNENKTPEWMQDDLVKDIPREKLNFLMQLFAQSSNKSQKELMANLLPMIKQAKKDGLTLEKDEIKKAIAAIKKHSTDQELEQINKIMKNRTNK